MPIYRHLHLRNLGVASERFRPQGGGSKDRPDEVADRDAHARKLRASFAKAVADLPAIAREQAQYRVPAAARGMAVAVEGRSNIEIEVGDLKLESRGLQLLSVQRGQGNQPDRAIFFLKERSAKSLLQALDKYQAYDEEDDDRRPNRFWLFESINDFREATIEDIWTDPDDRLSSAKAGVVEWEIWIRLSALPLFLRIVETSEAQLCGAPTDFIDMAVVNIRADRATVAHLIRASAAVVELRSASSFSSHYHGLDPEERADFVQTLASRLMPATGLPPLTTILDTGVNHIHPLLAPFLPPARCRTIRADWGNADHHGHGTMMAGVALYGDLNHVPVGADPLGVATAVESIIVTAPSDKAAVPAHTALSEAVLLAEQDPNARIFCLAQTAPGDANDGRQTSTSATVDQLAWNDGDKTRLFCVAAGNVRTSAIEPYEIAHYADRNKQHRLESPGQALNALTVGATTIKCPDDLTVLAPLGDLCPTARTAQEWRLRPANKPDIVMEGGNHVVDDGNPCSHPVKQTMILTTGRNVNSHPLQCVAETSAATAGAAGMATRLTSAYPRFRAETLRGMLVHAADWTPAMTERLRAARQLGASEGDAVASVLDCFGWGMPVEERVMASAGNALTMIIEDELSPFEYVDKRVRLREMKYFRLPWPTDILQALNQEEVQLRCTLSYFAEPDLHAGSRDRLDRYASHRLRFNLKAADDDHAEAQRRINTLAELEEGATLPPSAGPVDRGWRVGARRRSYGTIHHDIWTGRAHELAQRDGISVYPVRGWWADRRDPDYYDGRARFSLIVSIRSPRADIDLMAAVAIKVKAANLVENVAVIGT